MSMKVCVIVNKNKKVILNVVKQHLKIYICITKLKVTNLQEENFKNFLLKYKSLKAHI